MAFSLLRSDAAGAPDSTSSIPGIASERVWLAVTFCPLASLFDQIVTLRHDVTSSPDDERHLIEAAQADPARFAELYDRYVDRVYAFVSRRTGDRATAEDVTSEVFEQALTHLHRFEWRGIPLLAWLFRIAANAVADRWRQDARDAHEATVDVPDITELDNIERRLVLFQLVDRLPVLQRRVIHMRFVEDKSIREIAAATGRSEGAVKQLQWRALENLRKAIGHRE
jgi:RNA polymerase sigma-70 factor, ECF subfamily